MNYNVIKRIIENYTFEKGKMYSVYIDCNCGSIDSFIIKDIIDKPFQNIGKVLTKKESHYSRTFIGFAKTKKDVYIIFYEAYELYRKQLEKDSIILREWYETVVNIKF